MSTEQVTDLEKMKDPDDERFRINDLELLKSGWYSDAQVAVGDRIWKVHKSIVCQRSAYMEYGLFNYSDGEDSIPMELPFGTTEKEAELLLEFLYSGGIENIDKLSLEDCVVLSILAINFQVDSMITYAEVNLWDKLRTRLQGKPPSLSKAVSTQPPKLPTSEMERGVLRMTRDLSFEYQFEFAVDKAYSYSNKPCKLILADFVWAARSWMLGTSLLEELNRIHPKFGRDILTTLNKGPQTKLLRSTRPLENGTFCTKCAEQQGLQPRQALQLYFGPAPKST